MDKLLILNKIQEHYNFKKDAQFAEYLGIPAQNLSKWKLRNTFDAELIYTKCTQINPEWLLTGTGNMLKGPREPVVIPKSFIKPEVPIKEIPLLPLDAVAGMGSGEFTVMEGDILQYYKVVEFKSADFMIPVKGSSMQPKYYGGDLLACRFIKTFSYFQWGVPHVITIKDKGTLVKRVFQCKEDHEIELRSDNDNYPPFCIPKEDIVNISIVVGVIRLE